ncbi:MAG: hypothetical protein QOD98_1398 [Nocardioidaceae bacterium]|jgi:hypothetical protein|nr:hypothetical protein [Nocardioidaceae bacterium]
MRTRWLPVLALAVLAPVCAEYLWGYDDSTGHPGSLVGNLIIFTPLYGCPALLIREVARRRGLGWPGIVLLAAAFGVVEAGLVDQSMFSRDYRDIPYWHDMADPTYVAPIGLSIFLAVSFVANHVIASMAGPIALVEGLAGSRGREPWLGRPTIVVAALLYAGASALVLQDMFSTEDDHASAGQLMGAGAVALLLVAGALRTGRRPRTQCSGAAPSPWLVGPLTFVVGLGSQLLPPSPLGTDVLLLVYASAAGAIWWLSGRPGWGRAHPAAVAGGALSAFAIGSFWTEPIGQVTEAEKLGHNIALLVLVTLAALLAVRRGGARGSRVSVAG